MLHFIFIFAWLCSYTLLHKVRGAGRIWIVACQVDSNREEVDRPGQDRERLAVVASPRLWVPYLHPSLCPGKQLLLLLHQSRV